MVNTITDVWSLGGGVLRAMEAHTLLPGPDVAYGTLSFYQNYVVMALALGIGYAIAGFDIEVLKTILVLNPFYSVLVPRVTSVLTAIILLVVVYRFLKTHVPTVSWRLVLIVLAFGNVLSAIIIRSGKMWTLSTLLGVVSFIYLYRALTEERQKDSLGVPGRLSTISIVAAFLAMANFSFAGIFLINIPVLFFAFSRTRETLRRFFYATAVGFVAFGAFFVLNAANVINQTWPFVVQLFAGAERIIDGKPTLTMFESLTVRSRHVFEAYALFLLALVPASWKGIRDVLLLCISLLYIAVYLLAASFIFRVDQGLALNVRHIFPVSFLLLFLLAALKPPNRWVSRAILVLGFGIYVYTIFLLSVPTTYNEVYDVIVDRYGGREIRIEERVFELTLPMNKASYELYATSSCGSACQHMRMLPDDIAFRPLVVTEGTDPAKLMGFRPPDLIVLDAAIEGCIPVFRFGNEVSDADIYDIDINLGRMLRSSFFSLDRLGKNIYLYEPAGCPKLFGPGF